MRESARRPDTLASMVAENVSNPYWPGMVDAVSGAPAGLRNAEVADYEEAPFFFLRNFRTKRWSPSSVFFDRNTRSDRTSVTCILEKSSPTA